MPSKQKNQVPASSIITNDTPDVLAGFFLTLFGNFFILYLLLLTQAFNLLCKALEGLYNLIIKGKKIEDSLLKILNIIPNIIRFIILYSIPFITLYFFINIMLEILQIEEEDRNTLLITFFSYSSVLLLGGFGYVLYKVLSYKTLLTNRPPILKFAISSLNNLWQRFKELMNIRFLYFGLLYCCLFLGAHILNFPWGFRGAGVLVIALAVFATIALKRYHFTNWSFVGLLAVVFMLIAITCTLHNLTLLEQLLVIISEFQSLFIGLLLTIFIFFLILRHNNFLLTQIMFFVNRLLPTEQSRLAVGHTFVELLRIGAYGFVFYLFYSLLSRGLK